MRARAIPPDDERRDFAALRRRKVLITPPIRATLAKALEYQDIQRDTWAAGIIEATPPGQDPIERVRDALAEVLRLRNGSARWEERWIAGAIARERQAMSGITTDDRQDDILASAAETAEAGEEFEADRRRLGW